MRGVDEFVEVSNEMPGTKRYKDKDGNVFSLSAEDAKARGGMTLLKGQGKVDEPEADAADKPEPENKMISMPRSAKG